MCTSTSHPSCTKGLQVSNQDWTFLVDLCVYISASRVVVLWYAHKTQVEILHFKRFLPSTQHHPFVSKHATFHRL
ncbi:hypothetical protein K439DRAFT_227249 [Ramaria rubella]|nr:hypothetical protein K439DRAFT_227249 [Ramaria rubella]